MSNSVGERGQGLLDYISSEYTYLGVIGKLRRGISLTIVADLCGLKEKDLIAKLKAKGYDSKGRPLHSDIVDVTTTEHTVITTEIKQMLLAGLKKGYDTDFLIEQYHLDRKKASGVILDLRRKMKSDAEKLYPLSSIKGKQGKYKTMFTVLQRDLD